MAFLLLSPGYEKSPRFVRASVVSCLSVLNPFPAIDILFYFRVISFAVDIIA